MNPNLNFRNYDSDFEYVVAEHKKDGSLYGGAVT
jgi:hypothetical protein